MTAVSKVDGEYVCFAYENGAATPSTIFHVEITNTTNNEADRIWMTITDIDPSKGYYLDAVRADLAYDASANSFKCTEKSVTQPRTCYNPWYEQHYYTYGYKYGNETYVINIEGSVAVNGVDTKTGYKTDGIELKYSRKYPDGTVKNYTVKGMKNTGWGEDLVDYQSFIDENF